MRILFTSFPARGHLHPLIPLGLAARAAGHDVRFATGANVADWARLCGVDATAVGVSEQAAHEIAERDFSGPDRSGHMFTDVWVPAALPDLLGIASAWRPDLIVAEEEEYAGVLLAAILDVPCVTHSWSSPARPAVSREFRTRALAPIWSRHLPGSTPRRVGRVYLDACPPPFQTDDLIEIARTTRVARVRPGLFDGPPTDPPAWLADLPRPAAYVTLGTVAVFSTPDRLTAIARALAPSVASIVLTCGPNDPGSLGDLPPNVLLADYVPQSLVLPSVDLVVSHGGAGGTVAALVRGLPHLVLAGSGPSQLTSAAAVQRIGAGLSLAEGARDAASIRSAASRLLTEPAFAAAARRIGDELATLPGPAEVVGLLEALVD